MTDYDGYGEDFLSHHLSGKAASSLDDPFGVSQDDLEALKMERTMLTGQTPVQQARTILEEASPMAAMQLVRLAQNATNENVRLRASAEILNRAGVEKGEGKNEEGKEPWSDLFEKVVTTIENFANAGHDKPTDPTE